MGTGLSLDEHSGIWADGAFGHVISEVALGANFLPGYRREHGKGTSVSHSF